MGRLRGLKKACSLFETMYAKRRGLAMFALENNYHKIKH